MGEIRTASQGAAGDEARPDGHVEGEWAKRDHRFQRGDPARYRVHRELEHRAGYPDPAENCGHGDQGQGRDVGRMVYNTCYL